VSKGRLEAFSDGVLAIIITVMLLEMRVPLTASFGALGSVYPIFLCYVLSFVYIGIYWNNHHHMFHTVSRVGGKILWANLHLLFWLSLIPFTTGWLGENHFAAAPAELYGAVLFMAAVAYWILQRCIIASQGPQSVLRRAVGGDWKGKLSPALYVAGIASGHWWRWGSLGLYVLVALFWLIPDRRIERTLAAQSAGPD